MGDSVEKFGLISLEWPGVGKLLEESSEVSQILSKIIGSGGSTISAHNGNVDLHSKLIEELGDLFAALDFFIEANGLPEEEIKKRAQYKKQLYWAWRGVY